MFIERIGNCKDLEFLKYRLKKSEIHKHGFEAYAGTLKKFSNLKQLHFHLNESPNPEYKIDDKNFIQLAKAFAQLPQLEKIDIALDSMASVTDKGMSELLKSLQKQKNLINFVINFQLLPSISTDSMREMLNWLEVCKGKLRLLVLDFDQLPRISMDFYLKLFSKVGEMNALRRFEFYQNDEPYYNSEAVIMLLSSI